MTAIFIVLSIFAQVNTEWVRAYNGAGNSIDIPQAMVVDDVGNVYITGYSYGATTGRDYATLKYDTNGDLIWEARYDGPENEDDEAYDIVIDGSGNVYVTGRSGGTAGHYPRHMDYATIKYDSDGNELWVAIYNSPEDYDDEARAIILDASGNVYVTGTIPGPSSLPRIGTIKYDGNGNMQWGVRYAPSGYWEHHGADILVDAAGNIYVAAVAIIPECDYWVIKYDPDGSIVWEKNYWPAADYGWPCLALDGGNNLFLAGGSCENYSTSHYDCLLLKYSETGTELWKRFYNGPVDNFDIFNAIALDAIGNVYVTGESKGGDLSYDYATLKYDNSGSQLWASRYNGPGSGDDKANAIAVDNSGNVHVTGGSEGDYATIKYDADGNEIWIVRYETGTSCAIGTDNSGSIYVTGESSGDYLTIKYAEATSIGLCEFTATSLIDAILLSWSTESESSIYQYDLYRQEREDKYKKIVSIPGKGFSPTPKTYSHRDEDIEQGGTYLYKLGAMKTDGNTEWYGPVSATVIGEKPFLSISPNPFSDKVEIMYSRGQRADPSTSSGQGRIELEIFNAAGRLVKRFSLPTAYSILPTTVTWNGRDDDRRELPSGVYYCRLLQGMSTQTRKILLVR